MNNITNNYQQNFTALVPKAEYKGIVLKLTKSDKTRIAKLQSEIASRELELSRLELMAKTAHNTNATSYFDNQIGMLEVCLGDLYDSIRSIKIARLNQQKSAAEKKGLYNLDIDI